MKKDKSERRFKKEENITATLLLVLLMLVQLLRLRCSIEGYPKKMSHPAANNSTRIMIRATIHCIVLPTSCHGIVFRVFGCHPSARNGSTRFLVPLRRHPLRGMYLSSELATSLLSLSPSQT